MLDGHEFLRRVNGLDEDDRNHFRMLLETLIRCYGESQDAAAVVLFSENDSPVAQVLSLNCDDMEAYGLVRSVGEYLHFINTKDAPPKEKFN